jgi:hydroxyethylthiazole kinase
MTLPQEDAMTHSELVWSLLATLRQRRPLVHNITNFVVMNSTANALRAGGSPSWPSEEELEELLAWRKPCVSNSALFPT